MRDPAVSITLGLFSALHITSSQNSTMTKNHIVGVLALQGAFAEHLDYLAQAASAANLSKYTFTFLPVRTTEQLASCHALVIPGGESTSMSLVAERTGMLEPLVQFAAEKPMWGTCAGLIFLASEITNARPHQKALGGLAVLVARNAFGRQLDLFDLGEDFALFAPGLNEFRTIFIRAPVVTGVLEGAKTMLVGPRGIVSGETGYTVRANCTNKAPVEILHTLENGLVVAVRQGNKLGTSFHPELSHDVRFHGWFLQEFVVGTVE